MGEDFPTLCTLFLCPHPQRERPAGALPPALLLRAQGKAGRGPSGTWPVAYPSQAVHRRGKASAAPPPLGCCHGRTLCCGDRHWWPEQSGSVLGWENTICQDLRLGAESANKLPIEREPSGSLLKQLGGGGILCFVERQSVSFISSLALWPPTESWRRLSTCLGSELRESHADGAPGVAELSPQWSICPRPFPDPASNSHKQTQA